MTTYYIYRNDSHSYGFNRPLNLSTVFNTDLDEYLAHVYLHQMKIKPLRVNCTVAPLAEGCPLANVSTSMSNKTQLVPNSITNNYYTNLAQQHQQIIIINISKNLPITNDPRFMHYVDCISEYSDRMSVVNEQNNKSNKKIIQSYDYDYLPCHYLQQNENKLPSNPILMTSN
ncbi:hypothetical protein I4U23_022160 [Adineta vaga]|nr:hypothetical protein I4U23_022160 [Adineta vaga]